MRRYRQLDLAVEALKNAAEQEDSEAYHSAYDSLLAFVCTDVAKKKFFGATPPEHHEFLTPTPVSELASFYAFVASASESYAQVFQDLFALWHLQSKRQGTFVEVGAGDGVNLSNTYLLEKEYAWKGLLVEPNPQFHTQIETSRSAALDRRCVTGTTGETVTLNCTDKPEFSRIERSAPDIHDEAGTRNIISQIEQTSVCLEDLLTAYGLANTPIDYVSIDIEGLELEVVSSFDLKKHGVAVATIEHNFTDAEAGLDAEMARQGYRRVLKAASRFDAWYVAD